jgi:hypothetical protein
MPVPFEKSHMNEKLFLVTGGAEVIQNSQVNKREKT